jgi:(E)-4-hydroxy-3-methylbut-2-enyl-diphosphate synthase
MGPRSALKWQKPVRIGVNWGSLDQELLAKMMDENALLPEPKDGHEVLIDAIVESALSSASVAEKYGLNRNQIVLSAKVSEVRDLVSVYTRLAASCDYALHLRSHRSRNGHERYCRLHSSPLSITCSRH